MINVDASVKNIIYVKKDYIWNPATCSCENRKHLASTIADSVSTCDIIIEETFSINFNGKKVSRKTQIFLLAFLLITIALLIAVSMLVFAVI